MQARVMPALPHVDSRRAALLALAPMTVAVVLARPNFDAPAAAWFAYAPALLWAAAAPAWRRFAGPAFLALWLAEVASMTWLRHLHPPLGYLAILLSTAYFALYPWVWLLAARAALPRLRDAAFPARASGMLGLAGLWIALEWVRGHLFTGCPWMPLGATQWKASPIFAICPWTGPWGPSFILILFNLAIARYAYWITRRNTERLASSGLPISPWQGLRFCPDFYLALAPVALCVSLFLADINRRRTGDDTLFTAAIVQTDFDPNAKWSPDRAAENLGVVKALTRDAAKLTAKHPFAPYSPGAEPGTRGDADFILWPEAALPFSVGNPGFDTFLDKTAAETRTTLLAGAISKGPDDGYYNGIHIVTPDAGLQPEFYAKRHLVPFGEYVPLAGILPLRKLVPIPHDSLRGERHTPLTTLRRDGVEIRLGTLVCYEDIFPELAREMALGGADALVVVTNDAWYGREGGAYQHAATSALMAASTGLPVLRCGNAGWSGVITPTGSARPATDATGSIYFRGAALVPVRGTPADRRAPTFFVRHGDWFPALGAAFAALTAARLHAAYRARRARAADAPPAAL